MDPVTAFGIATNVLAFVDFAGKLISATYKVYNSADEAFGGVTSLENIARNLQDLGHDTEYQPNPLAPARAGGGGRAPKKSKAEKQLESVSREAQQSAQRLLDAVAELMGMPRNSKWDTFRQALACVWTQSKIKALEDELERLRRQVDTTLLICLRQQVDRLKRDQERSKSQDQSLDNDIKTFMADCRAWQTNLVSELAQNDWTGDQGTDAFSDRMRQFAKEDREARFKNMMLQRLSFGEMAVREDEICEAYKRTFAWLFANEESGEAEEEVEEETKVDDDETEIGEEDDGSSAKEDAPDTTGVGFSSWLQAKDGSNLYWVTGKAGSGKSTLMKYIYQNPRTQELLKEGDWGHGNDIATGAFFFWNPGSAMQKSRLGLLRTLLQHILNARRDLVLQVFNERYQMYHGTTIGRWEWTWRELRDAFQRLLSVTADSSQRLVFLIDGLDELDGTQQETKNKETAQILDLIISAGKLPHVKVCVSSRPWLVFEDAFKEKPSLTMELLNRPDILLYVTSQFEKNEYFSKLKERQPEFAAELIKNIVDKSSAVFFWVYLVVNSLLTGLSNSDRISDLQRRLDELPSELEALFGKIMLSLEPFYYTHACQLFQIIDTYEEVVTNRLRDRQYEPVSLLALYFADEDDPNSGLTAPTKALTREEANEKEEEMRRRLNSRCQGLLEATEKTASNEEVKPPRVVYGSRRAPPGGVVRYLHRTARDFIHMPETWEKILAATEDIFDPRLAVANSVLLQMKTTRMEECSITELQTFVGNCCYAVGVAKFEDKAFLTSYLDEVDKAANALVKTPLAGGKPWAQTRARLPESPQTWISVYSSFRVVSLLDYAIGPPQDFPGIGRIGTEEDKKIRETLCSYAVCKIRTMTPLAESAALWWINKCDQDEIEKALEAACPGVKKKAQKQARTQQWNDKLKDKLEGFTKRSPGTIWPWSRKGLGAATSKPSADELKYDYIK